MRIAIASDDGQRIADHTGRCACFVIYDVQEEGRITASEVRLNTFTLHAHGKCQGDSGGTGHSGGADRHAALLDAISDCEVFICRGMGPRLVADLQGRGISVIFCSETNADEAASKFVNGTLLALDTGTCEKH